MQKKGFRKFDLSREEFEFKRETISSISKLGVYFILQLPPIIGILPVSEYVVTVVINSCIIICLQLTISCIQSNNPIYIFYNFCFRL